MVGSMLHKFLRTKQTNTDACLKANQIHESNSLAQVDTFVFHIPSQEQCPSKSSIVAPMTCIAKFVQVPDDSTTSKTMSRRMSTNGVSEDPLNGLCWLNEKKAKTNTNIHGCVIHDFLRHMKMKTPKSSFMKGVFAYETEYAKVLNGTRSIAIQKHIQALINDLMVAYKKRHRQCISKQKKTHAKHDFTALIHMGYLSLTMAYTHWCVLIQHLSLIHI